MQNGGVIVLVLQVTDEEEFAFSAGQGRTVSPMFAKQQRAVEKRILVADWLQQLTGAVVPTESDEAFRAALSDGVTLCRLLNALQPNTIPRVRGRERAEAPPHLASGSEDGACGHLAQGHSLCSQGGVGRCSGVEASKMRVHWESWWRMPLSQLWG